jgi:hypothetical protein
LKPLRYPNLPVVDDLHCDSLRCNQRAKPHVLISPQDRL